MMGRLGIGCEGLKSKDKEPVFVVAVVGEAADEAGKQSAH